MKEKKIRLTKKRELIYDEKKFIEWRIGYSLCTVYRQNNRYRTIELWNFGYCPSNKDFYYTRGVHLPKKIKDYFNGAAYSKDNISKMEELGIYNIANLQELINIYKKTKKEEKQKTINFSKILKL